MLGVQPGQLQDLRRAEQARPAARRGRGERPGALQHQRAAREAGQARGVRPGRAGCGRIPTPCARPSRNRSARASAAGRASTARSSILSCRPRRPSPAWCAGTAGAMPPRPHSWTAEDLAKPPEISRFGEARRDVPQNLIVGRRGLSIGQRPQNLIITPPRPHSIPPNRHSNRPFCPQNLTGVPQNLIIKPITL